MEKRYLINILFILLIVFSLSYISAVINIGNLSHSIDKVYAPGNYLKGWINISLKNEVSNSLIRTSEGDAINIIEFLRKNNNNFLCNPSDCESGYSATNEESEKTFSLNTGESKIIGFKLTGKISDINSINFTINSNAPSSCYNQLEIDILNNGNVELGNNKIGLGDCSPLKNYGCFNSKITSQEKRIVNNYEGYCQKIKLTESPGFKIGTWIRNESGFRNLTMSIYGLDGTEEAYCNLPSNKINNIGSEVSCDVSYPLTNRKDYYICIYSNKGDGDYRIKGYSSENGCGFYGDLSNSPENLTASYGIFVTGKIFDSIGELNIGDNIPSNPEKLSNIIKEYLVKKYGTNIDNSIDCSKGCIIPIKLWSRLNQDITIKNIKIDYNDNSGPTISNKVYDIKETPSIVNMDFQIISLNNLNLSVPEYFGTHNFSLSLNSTKIFSENLFIERISQITSLNPLTAMAAYPTNFEIKIDKHNSNDTIKNYEWNFGNGDILTTTKNIINYAYNSTGKYNLKVSITDSSKRSSSKVFNINVESPKKAVNLVLSEEENNFNNINEEIKDYDKFYQEVIKKSLNLSDIERELKKIKRDNSTASGDEEYINIMKNLLNLDIPSSIITTKKGNSITIYPQEKNINLDVLKSVGRGDYSSEEKSKYEESILAWNSNNIETKVNFKEISGNFDGGITQLLNVFEIKIKKINDNSDDVYIFINKLKNLEFDGRYIDGKDSGYSYIKLDGTETEKLITLSTTEDIDFSELPIFISPSLTDLQIDVKNYGKFEKKSKLNLFIWAILLIIIFGFIMYIIVQEWYKRKYENYLFKNRNNLFNIITYINKSKTKGMENSKIRSSLKKSGWNTEQINYAMKKYHGKRTGMLEIPIFKIFNIFKRKKNNSNLMKSSQKFNHNFNFQKRN